MRRSSIARLVASALVIGVSASLPLIEQPPPETTAHRRVARPPLAPSMDVFGRILVRNQLTCLLTVSGLVTGGLTTVATLSTAAFTTTQAAVLAQSRLRLSPGQLAALILPHGLLELGGFIVAGAAGLGGLPLLIALAEGNRARAAATLHESAWYAGLAVALIAVAAVVEVAITPRVAAWVLSS